MQFGSVFPFATWRLGNAGDGEPWSPSASSGGLFSPICRNNQHVRVADVRIGDSRNGRARSLPLWRSVENTQLRSIAAALLLGSALGCAYTAIQTLDGGRENAAPLISPTEPARNIAPLAVPPREKYGAPFVHSQIHPVTVAAAMALFSLLGFSLLDIPKRPSSVGESDNSTGCVR